MLLLVAALHMQSSGAAASLVAQLKKNYSGSSAVYGEFEQSIFWPVREKTTRQKGTLALAPGNRFRVEAGQESYISNGVFCWQYSKNTRQCTIDNFSSLDRSVHPSYLLSNLLEHCTFRETKKSGKQITLEAMPDAGSMTGYSAVRLVVEPASGTIALVMFTDKNGNVHTYDFKKTVFKKNYPENHFEFEVPRDAEIIDHRH